MSKQRFHRTKKRGKGARLVAAASLLGIAFSAYAFDHCKVVLCLAGNWQQIQDCVPDVTEATHCMSRGKCWPRCPGSNTNVQWAASQCPPQYTVLDPNTGARYCTMTGVTDIAKGTDPHYMRVGWSAGGTDISYQYSEEAKADLLSAGVTPNPRFDTDFEVWVATKPADACALGVLPAEQCTGYLPYGYSGGNQ
jgi:hypothetical protein